MNQNVGKLEWKGFEVASGTAEEGIPFVQLADVVV